MSGLNKPQAAAPAEQNAPNPMLAMQNKLQAMMKPKSPPKPAVPNPMLAKLKEGLKLDLQKEGGDIDHVVSQQDFTNEFAEKYLQNVSKD